MVKMEKTKEARQLHIWENGRKPGDLSPYEQRLIKKLKPKIRRDEQ